MVSSLPVLLSDGTLQLEPVPIELPGAAQWRVCPPRSAAAIGVITLHEPHAPSPGSDSAASTPPGRAMLQVDMDDHAPSAEIQMMVRGVRLACQWAFSNLDLAVVAWLGPTSATVRSVVHDAGFRVHALPHRAAWDGPDGPTDAWYADLVPEDLTTADRPLLTAREQHVLAHMAQGRSNAQIAEHLGISENTVKNHVRSILEHLQAPSRTSAVVTALSRGMVSLE